METCKCVVFYAPDNYHILSDDCPRDLVRFEGVFDTYMLARNFSIRMENLHAPKRPCGYPETNYKICSLSQWEDWLAGGLQLTLFQ